jgi:hypothetical protein
MWQQVAEECRSGTAPLEAAAAHAAAHAAAEAGEAVAAVETATAKLAEAASAAMGAANAAVAAANATAAVAEVLEVCVKPVGDGWLRCLSLAGHLTTAVLQLEGDLVFQSDAIVADSFPCVELLLALLDRLDAEACTADADTDTGTQSSCLRQLESVGYTLQVVAAAIRQYAMQAATKLQAFARKRMHPHDVYIDCFLMGRSGVAAALQLISSADDAVLGSLQCQQMLQSCTSLLLTCSSLLYSSNYAASPVDLAVCVQLLQLLQQSEAFTTAGGSSCGMSQSLAAGLALVGRCLLTLELALSPAGNRDSSNSSMGQSPAQQGRALRSQVQEWLSECAGDVGPGAPVVGVVDSNTVRMGVRVQAGIVQEAVHGILSCMQSINHCSSMQHQQSQRQQLPHQSRWQAAAAPHLDKPAAV